MRPASSVSAWLFAGAKALRRRGATAFTGALGGFDPRGRLSRRAYGRRVLQLGLLAAVLLCLSIALAAQGWRAAGLAVAGSALLPVLAGLAQTVRRLHDRGRTGLWLALPLAQMVLGLVPIEDQADAHPVAVLTYTLAVLVAGPWFLIETLGRSGITGQNSYRPGEDLASTSR